MIRPVAHRPRIRRQRECAVRCERATIGPPRDVVLPPRARLPVSTRRIAAIHQEVPQVPCLTLRVRVAVVDDRRLDAIKRERPEQSAHGAIPD
eukprot:4621420-Prymnesium_polylepis.1